MTVINVKRKMTTQGTKDEQETPIKADVAVITPRWGIQLGFVVAVIVPLVWYLGSWSTNVSRNLETLVKGQAEMKEIVKDFGTRISVLEVQMRDFKLVGSPAVIDLGKRVLVLEHDLELHRATDEKNKVK